MVCYYHLQHIFFEGGVLYLATKEQRQNKLFVEKMLQIQGVDYDEWLDEIHSEFIQNNNKVILEALESKLKKGTDKKEEQNSQSFNNSSNVTGSDRFNNN